MYNLICMKSELLKTKKKGRGTATLPALRGATSHHLLLSEAGRKISSIPATTSAGREVQRQGSYCQETIPA